MGSKFPLDYLRAFAGMHEFYRVFQADDIHPAISIDVIDHRGEGRRFSGAGRTGNQDHALMIVAKFLYDWRHAKFVQFRYFVRNVSEGCANTGFLAKNIDPEPAAVFTDIGEVQVATRVKPVTLVFGQDFVDISLQFSIAEIAKADRGQVAMQPEHRGDADREVDIGAALLQAEFQERIDFCHQHPPCDLIVI